MRNLRMLISSLLMIFTLFLGMNRVSAADEETFSRYSRSFMPYVTSSYFEVDWNNSFEIQLLTTTTSVATDNSDIPCDGVLGPFKKDLEGILKIIRLIAPLFILYLGVYDYAAATLSKDAELLKKANSKLLTRIILMVVLFFLPILLNLILGIIDPSYTACID